MDKLILKGCGTALVTPFTEAGEVDYDAYAALVDSQVGGGVDFLVALATTGETPTLSAEEKTRLLRITKERCAGLPVVVGCGSNSVGATLANMDLLAPLGPDAWLVVVPFYNKPTQEGQYLYFKKIASSTDLPVVIYNVPGRTGANMSAQTCQRLACEVDNIIATKEASGKFDQVAEILKGAPEGFSVLSGDDDMTRSIMEIGAAGVISVASNVAPGKVSAMTRAALEGRWEEARELDATLSELFRACFVESNPIPVKAALELLGFMKRDVRLPLTPATPQTVQTMTQTLKNIGIL